MVHSSNFQGGVRKFLTVCFPNRLDLSNRQVGERASGMQSGRCDCRVIPYGRRDRVAMHSGNGCANWLRNVTGSVIVAWAAISSSRRHKAQQK